VLQNFWVGHGTALSESGWQFHKFSENSTNFVKTSKRIK